MTEIIVTDKIILDFYRENPNLDFIMMNHIFIDILKKLSSNLSDTINNTMNAKVLSMLTDMSKDLNSFKQDFATIKSDMLAKFHDIKKEYIDDVKLILNNNSLTYSEKIANLLEKNNESLAIKTSVILNDLIPKNQDKLYSQIDLAIKNLHNTINTDTIKLLENINKDDKNMQEFIDNINSQFNKTVQNLQQPIFSFIQSSEERTNKNIVQIRDKFANQQTVQENLNAELSVFLNKYKYNSSVKGNVSESELYSVLQRIFPSDEIIDCRGETATCDYKVNRLNKNKPTILFENKDYSRSATTDEIQKFERDVKTQKHHGIFLSQNSSITYKENYQIDVIDGLIHLYLPNAQYNEEKIAVAVNIVDSLSQKLNMIKTSLESKPTHININQNDIDELLEEYNEFIKQKNSIIETVKINHKQLLDRLEELQMSSIKKLLIKNNVIQNDEDFKCKFCNAFSGKNKASLAAHIRTCKSNSKGANIFISTDL